MQILPLSEPIPAGATDMAIGILPHNVAFIHNRVVTLRDGGQILCPPGWDLFFDGQVLMVLYDVNSEVENA